MKTMVSKERSGATISLLQPTRPILCTTKNEDGTDHVAPFSWVMPISCDPPRVAFALQNKRGKKQSQTLDNILRAGEFVLNLPVMGQEETLVKTSYLPPEGCGKYVRAGFKKEAAACVNPVRIPECASSLECKAYDVVDGGGDHTLVLADILCAVYDPELYDEDLCPDVPRMRPLINLREYRYSDRQEHLFLDSSAAYRITAYYDVKLDGGEEPSVSKE